MLTQQKSDMHNDSSFRLSPQLVLHFAQRFGVDVYEASLTKTMFTFISKICVELMSILTMCPFPVVNKSILSYGSFALHRQVSGLEQKMFG